MKRYPSTELKKVSLVIELFFLQKRDKKHKVSRVIKLFFFFLQKKKVNYHLMSVFSKKGKNYR